MEKMKLFCIGDSNTYGFNPQTAAGYPSGTRWTDRLEGWEVINYGISGMTIPRVPSFFPNEVRKNRPDLVFVMLGTNDLLENDGAEEAADRMEVFLTSIKASGISLLLVSPPPLQQGAWVDSEELISESRKLGDLYRDIAERNGYMFADAGEWDIELMFDGVHFSPAGHEKFAGKLGEMLRRIC